MNNTAINTFTSNAAVAAALNNAVIYPRYSSTGQNEQTIETQIQLCKEYAEKRGLKVIKIFDGDKAKSASKETEKRKDLHRMLAAAESGTFQYIIVYELNRFARNRAESVLFKSQLEKYGVRVLSVCEDIRDDEGGELYEMILEWRDEKYSRDLSRRVRHGLDTSVANGTFCGGTLICGYKIRKEPTNKPDRFIKYVEIDEEQAVIVRYVFKQYSVGISKQKIAAVLNEQGKRIDGKPFKARTFDKWLYNEKYTGVFSFGDRVCDNMYPAIIDRATFDKAQKLLMKNQYFKKSNVVKEPFLLNSKLYCGYCGALMVADGGVSHTGNTYKYYTCKQTKQGKCAKNREPKDAFERWVTAETIQFFRNPKFLNKLADDLIAYQDRKTGEGEIKAVETRIAVAKKQIDDALNSMIAAESVATKKLLDRKINELSVLVDELETQKAELRLERGLPLTRQDIFDFIAEFTDGDPTDKEFQKTIIDNLVVTVYAYDDQSVIYFSVGNRKDTPLISKRETDEIIEKRAEPAVVTVGSTLDDIGGEGGI
ncbi:MAG: recombinase family protein [Firmicutes bacterium]|nr:recombinase family protein [Bacillota bacterium]